MTAKLFTPIQLRGLELSNRVIVAPMCQYSAVDGLPTDWHLIHLGGLSMSGSGMVIVEAVGVEPRGRVTHGCVGLYSDACEAALKRIVDAWRSSWAMPGARRRVIHHRTAARL
jgi:2,4-dienoyl-CoA reductase-like NADH-dependent reductase (Old Yellow Enzyme family)